MKVINQGKVPTVRCINFLHIQHPLTTKRTGKGTLSVAIFIHSSKFARIGTFRTGVWGRSSTACRTVPFGVRGGDPSPVLALRRGDPWVVAAATTFLRSRCLFATLSSRRARFSAESSFMRDSVPKAF